MKEDILTFISAFLGLLMVWGFVYAVFGLF